VIRRPARVIVKRCTAPDNRTSVLFRAFAPPSILRLSAFKTHLKKHGERYLEEFKRQDTPAMVGGSTGSNEIEEEWATIQGSSGDQVNTLPSLSDDWESLLSLSDVASGSMGMQTVLSAGVSYGSPLILSPCPRIAPNFDNGYFLSPPPRASPLPSSQYSSPMLPTPALTPNFAPTLGLGFAGDVGVQMGSCLATRDWTQVSWQDTQFIG